MPRGKTGPRTVILQPEAVAFFARVVGKRGKNEPLVARPDGQGWKPSDQQRPMGRPIAKAQLDPDESFYALRHSYISCSIEAGMPLTVLAKNCGTSVRMIEALADVMCLHGIPEHIRCDNGPEMVPKALCKWIANTDPQIQYIALGSTWKNGCFESFNGKMVDECMKEETFYSLKEPQTVIGLWQNTYNRARLHLSLGNLPPASLSFPDLAFRLPMAATMQ